MSFFFGFLKRQFLTSPPKPTTSLKEKVAIVTGSNVGLGKEASRWLVQLGATRVILACRNVEKGQAAAKDIQATTACSTNVLEVWQLDMSSYASVQSFAKRVEAELPRLDILVLNAGIMTKQFRMTEGNEETITTNVVSTALLGMLLHPKLRETAIQRGTYTHLTVTSPELYEVAKFTERKAPSDKLFATLAAEKQSDMSDRYHVSKLLVVFFIKSLSPLSTLASSKVIVNCVAPGLCQSELGREMMFPGANLIMKVIARPTEVGSRTLVGGATAGPDSHGQYMPDCKIAVAKGLCKGEAGANLEQRVWDELEEKLESIQPGVTAAP